MLIQKTIEIVRTDIEKYSSLSLVSATSIQKSLSKKYSNVIITNINSSADLNDLILRKPDLVFLGVKFIVDSSDKSKKIWIGENLENNNITHTGSTSSAHKLDQHKDLAKDRMIQKGITTSPFHIIRLDEPYNLKDIELKFPLFLKPLSKGGGEGIDECSVVRDDQELKNKIETLRTNHEANVLIERYLSGREFSIAVIRKINSDELIAMPIELVAPKNENNDRMLSNSVKTGNSEEILEITDKEEKDTIMNFAKSVFNALGARDYGRIDIRFDRNNEPNFLEANLIPSIIDNYGSFPKAYKINENVDYDEMINNIVELALSRQLKK